MKKVKNIERKSRFGFTLVEVIVTLVLVAIISLFAGAAIVSVVQGFMQAKENAESAQKVHLAMNRITHDLLLATNIVSGANSITFDTLLASGAPVTRTLAYAGGNVTLGGQTLLDRVASFQISYVRYNAGAEVVDTAYVPGVTRGVEIRLTRSPAVNVQYTDRVFPRNTIENRGML